MKILAIVIPAHKHAFFEQALCSIASQTCQDFNCYIFDDAGTKEIKEISGKFPKFEYHRFDENLGGKNLVAHWNRCLEKIDEEWVWLFSDDDIMGKNCVEEFYKKQKYHDTNLFRFKHNVINEFGIEIFPAKPIKNEYSFEFLKSTLNGNPSRLQEHIFNWKELKELGSFIEFPLAWCSDIATWCLLGKEKQIIAIDSAVVHWRMSENNISSRKNDLKEKLLANRLFYLWCVQNFKLPLKYKLKFAVIFMRYYEMPFSQYFQRPVFRSPILILSVLLISVRKLYLKLKRILII